ncbi:PPC domain-containing DNA-binding protein [Burkholderia sp. Ax-1719]|uniref:PPC domain-containing DNA-binding protein n=1 Tax=Burkholderia sp. Ax-1719 TaxID=2608334 RepID=UPI00141E85A1|nr:PPC domain-containing DNA-binding protein [Burkholderia sp. Ax-1719]NIE66855.1 DNA-binding protein [Burkholderia sp. Ax-1719]
MNTTTFQSAEQVTVETGRFGRLVVARVRPNEDLTCAVEALCKELGIKRAVVRGVVGSLIDANLAFGAPDDEHVVTVKGPGVEILNVSGEVVSRAGDEVNALLSATVADPQGQMYAGRLRRGSNLSFITIEVTFQEWEVQSIH